MQRHTPWLRQLLVKLCLFLLIVLLLVPLLFSPPAQRVAATDMHFAAVIQHDLQFAAQQLNITTSKLSPKSYPELTKSDGSWETSSASGWTSGFFPGALWLIYQATGDSTWLTKAQSWQAGLEGQKTSTDTHDVGFIIFSSFGNGYRLTGNDAYRQVILTAASSLAQRYNSTVGCIRSWGAIADTSNFQVIIDNMMNLELLFWAAKHGGKAEWYDMAVSHALKTMANHIRPDGSTYQLVNYNPTNGTISSKATKQGYQTETTWSRGQAWALYGFTVAYRETGDVRFLETARNAADYFISHLPADKVPYWDFQAPAIPNEPRDSSAAAIAASGLIELSQRETDAQRQARYLQAAQDILTALSSSAYLAEGTTSQAILLQGTRNKPKGAYNTGLIYGDYYFVEALLRYPTTPPPPDTAPPVATVRTPAANSTEVGVGTNVMVVFNEEIVNVNAMSFTLHKGTLQVATSVSYDAASHTATLYPTADLEPATTYTARLTDDITDRAGNKLVPVSWTFTTAALLTSTPMVTKTPTATKLPTATKTPPPTKTPMPTKTPTFTPTPGKVNSQVKQEEFKTISSTTVPDVSYPSQSPNGVVVLRLSVENQSNPLTNVTFRVNKLTLDNYLLNADSGPGQVGSKLSVPNSILPSGNQFWDKNEKLVQEFRIGLLSSKSFSFRVDVYANKVKIAAAEAGGTDTTEAEAFVESFVLDIDPANAVILNNTIYLPIVEVAATETGRVDSTETAEVVDSLPLDSTPADTVDRNNTIYLPVVGQ